MGQGNDEIEAPDPEAAQSDHYHDDGYDNYSDDEDDDDDLLEYLFKRHREYNG